MCNHLFVDISESKLELTLEEILKHFFETHDPTQLNKQGNDVGTQYRSTILFLNDIWFNYLYLNCN